MPLLAPEITARLGALQTLDNAISYHGSRLDEPCPRCATTSKCTDHACDVAVLEDYQDRYVAAFNDTVAGMDTSDLARVLRPGDDLPPPTLLLIKAITGHLRKICPGEPVMTTTLDGHPVAIDLAGHHATVRPLNPAPGSQTHA
jgi:hypothetical protein